jgi:hypothetical protein
VKHIEGKYHVFGCFCSLECATAYNFSDCHIGVDEAFHRYAMINQLARDLGISSNINMAPSKYALCMFGGHMNIHQFRAANASSIVDLNFPPLMSLTQQIEEINNTDIMHDFKYIPIDHDRIARFQERLKLKRDKSTINGKNTLESTMNLKFV